MAGTLDIITGPMFSGKSTELLRRLLIEAELGSPVLYINHALDKERSSGNYSTHNPLYRKSVENCPNIKFISLENLRDIERGEIVMYDIIGIDEANFFPDLKDKVEIIVEELKKHVIVSGLTGSYQRTKFGQILDLEPLSDTFTKLRSYCKKCCEKGIRRHAPFTHRLINSDELTVVGGKDSYIPVCRECYQDLN